VGIFVIRLTDISKSYGDSKIPAVNRLTLRVEAGEFLVLLGESGCGKTTTLKMINRLIEPTSGTIEVAGRDVSEVDPVKLRRSIGYVFQESGLFPHRTIGENVGAVPRLLGWSREKTTKRTNELMELVGLDPIEFRRRKPDELSGGQRQRVGVARALAASPDVMLMDEPFGALDPITRSGLQDEFRKLQHRLNLTVVMVTHDVMEALLMADRIAVMDAGQIVALGTPRVLLDNPGHPYAESLLDTPKRQADILEQLTRRDDVK
jgi:osmoprotectant transport system ATP-binding protein